MAKVYVTQVPHRRDNDTGAFVPTVNIAPAIEYGEIVVMMPPQTAFPTTGDLTAQLRERLQDYDYEAGDCLVALGDPIVIAVACAILGSDGEPFTILKWDRMVRRYFPVIVDV